MSSDKPHRFAPDAASSLWGWLPLTPREAFNGLTVIFLRVVNGCLKEYSYDDDIWTDWVVTQRLVDLSF